MNWSEDARRLIEETYLASDQPWKQSGFSGPYERWESLRRPVAECIQRPGSFLDIGCANGYLLECLLRWSAHFIEPFGMDISEALVDLARSRLPSATFWVGNAAEWTPPQRFDFVRTELCYVRAEEEPTYLRHLLDRVVAPGGRLLVANYVEGDVEAGRVFDGARKVAEIVPHLRSLGTEVESWRDGYDRVKERRVRVAIIKSSKQD